MAGRASLAEGGRVSVFWGASTMGAGIGFWVAAEGTEGASRIEGVAFLARDFFRMPFISVVKGS